VGSTATEIWGYRGLIGNFAQRELKVKYKRSALGWLWSLINPAATLATYTLVFGYFLKVTPPVAGNGHTKSFALYLFAALVIWNFFSNVINGSMLAMVAAGPLLKKVYFPPAAPVIGNALAVLVQTGLEVVILLAVLIVVGNIAPTVLLLPFILALLALFSLGTGLILGLFNVYFRDVGYLVGIALNLLFYATPIIYPLSIVPDGVARTLININPLTQFVGAARDVTYSMQIPSFARMAYLTVASVLSLAVGWWVFHLKARDVSEEL
jgi:ABC-type polysaccharide/polyol phosphate export permease